jgi:predicted methyltransferase
MIFQTRRYVGPLLTSDMLDAMRAALDAGAAHWQGSFDLDRTRETIVLSAANWRWRDEEFPWPERLKERTIHVWDGEAFVAAQRYATSLIKLVPTPWGAPTFEIDGIKMLPTAQTSPYADAQRKVALVAPRGKRVLDTCGGLGYFARACLEEGVASVQSFEKNADVLWLRTLNPWSPDPGEANGHLTLEHADVSARIATLAAESSTPSCTIHRASASPVNCTRSRSTTNSLA